MLVLYRLPDDDEDIQRVFIIAKYAAIAFKAAEDAVHEVMEASESTDEDVAEVLENYSRRGLLAAPSREACSRNAFVWIAYAMHHLCMAALRHVSRGEPFEIRAMGVHECSGCGVHRDETTLRACGGCGCVRYCSTACQKKDWQQEHKKVCRSMRKCAAGAEHLERKTLRDLVTELKDRVNANVTST